MIFIMLVFACHVFIEDIEYLLTSAIQFITVYEEGNIYCKL